MTTSERYDELPYWRVVSSFILDFFTVFFGAGFVVAVLSGDTTSEGFSLSGGPALLFVGVMIAYFVMGNRFLGGTIWRRVLGVAPRRS